jgi:hypothetical protein
VAVLSLYLTNLKRAEIVVDVAPDQQVRIELGAGRSWGNRIWPTDARLIIPLVAFNVGARTGVLTRIELKSFTDGPDPPLFRTQSPRLLMDPSDAFEGGQLRVYTPIVAADLDLPKDPYRGEPPEFSGLDGRLQGRAVRIVVAFRFLRGRSLFPRGRSRHLVAERSFPIDVSVQQFIDATRVD